jgi:hypothetical protein
MSGFESLHNSRPAKQRKKIRHSTKNETLYRNQSSFTPMHSGKVAGPSESGVGGCWGQGAFNLRDFGTLLTLFRVCPPHYYLPLPPQIFRPFDGSWRKGASSALWSSNPPNDSRSWETIVYATKEFAKRIKKLYSTTGWWLMAIVFLPIGFKTLH